MIIIQKHLDVYGNINFETKITGQTGNNNNDDNIAGRVDVEIMVPLKYLSNFWRTLEMPIVKLNLFWLGLEIVL